MYHDGTKFNIIPDAGTSQIDINGTVEADSIRSEDGNFIFSPTTDKTTILTGVVNDSLRVEETSLLKGTVTTAADIAVGTKAVVNDSLRVEETALIKGALTANTHAIVNDSLRVEETSLLKGTMTTAADIAVGTKAVVNDSLRVEETALIKGALTANTHTIVNDSLRVEETSLLKGTVTTAADVAVGTKAVVNDSLRVEETALIKGALTANTHAIVNDSLRVEETSLLKGTVTTAADIAIGTKAVVNDSLRVEETSLLKGNVTMNANLDIDDSLDVDGVLQVSPVVDSVAINGKLYVSGVTSIGSVSGDSLNLRELTVTDSAFIDTLTSNRIVGNNLTTLRGNDGNTTKTLLSLVNTDEPASSEILQSSDIWGYVQGTSDNGSSFSDVLVGKITFGKSSDFYNASGNADDDSYIRLSVRNNGIARNTLFCNYYYTALEQGADQIIWDGTAFYGADDSYDLGKSGNRINDIYSDNIIYHGGKGKTPAIIVSTENTIAGNDSSGRWYNLAGNSRITQKAGDADSTWWTVDNDSARVGSNNPFSIYGATKFWNNITSGGTIEGATLTEGSNAVPNVTDNLSVFAATTSAQLAGVLSDETGSGVAVFGTAPSFTDSITVSKVRTGASAMTLDVTGSGNSYVEIIQDNYAGYLAVGRTSATESSVISVTDGGADNAPGFWQMYSDGGTGYWHWSATDGTYRIANSQPADDDAGGYAIIDADNGTIGASGQAVNGSTITGTTFTDGTISITGGALTGGSSIDATNVSNGTTTNGDGNPVTNYTTVKTWCDSTITGEMTLSSILPQGYVISHIIFKNTTANQITNLDFGFTDGGGEIVGAANLLASDEGSFTINQKIDDFDAADDIYISADAWNGANLIIWIKMERIW